MTAAAALAAARLFGGLGEDVLEDVARLLTEVSFVAGEVVFRQGDPGDRLLLVAEGELEALLEVPGAPPVHVTTISAGQIVGELSLLGGGMRTATVRAVVATTGWALARSAFDVLRHDVRPAATAVVRAVGTQAVHRLDRFYRRCAEDLEGEPAGDEHQSSIIGEVSPERGEADYLLSVLFFRDFTREQVSLVTAGLPRLAVSRGSVLTPMGEHPAALWVVLRGAVETRMRGAEASRLLRLAGPGRTVGHSGLLGSEGFVGRVESRARERSVLIEVSWPRVSELLADDAPGSRRFAAALWTDVVRALQQGQRPLARTRRTNAARPVRTGLALTRPAGRARDPI